MLKVAITALIASALVAGCTPIRSYHGYNPDESQPADIAPGDDTRSTVLARLGTPSTKSIFDENTWFYMSATQESFAFFKPKVSEREVVAIRFGEDNVVDEVVQYDANDGEVIQYASRKTPTRGRELSLLEQLVGSAGTVRLPGQEDQVPGQIPGQR
ncbi:MAG: outer membrane protein assembly factor BamE [Hyphomonadaceae bacterium]